MKNKFKRSIDACMLAAMLVLMAFQVTEEMAHEWLGIAMVLLVIIHQLLNRKWYGVLLKGRYNGYRILTTAVTLLLLAAFTVTAFSGMAMSGYAVPFLYGMGDLSDPQTLHLAMAHWTFILMGLHLGLHIPLMMGKLHLARTARLGVTLLVAVLACYGLYLFVQNNGMDYLLFRMHFSFFDDKSGALVILDNVLLLLPWFFAGTETVLLFRRKARK